MLVIAGTSPTVTERVCETVPPSRSVAVMVSVLCPPAVPLIIRSVPLMLALTAAGLVLPVML